MDYAFEMGKKRGVGVGWNEELNKLKIKLRNNYL